MTEVLSDELRNEIGIAVADSSSFAVEAFAGVYMKRLEDAELLFDANVEALQCRGPRGRKIELHGYAEDSSDGTLAILCAQYFGRDAELKLTDVRRPMGRAIAFVEESVSGWLASNLEPSSREAELAEYFGQQIQRDEYSRVRVLLITDGTVSERIRYLETGELAGMPVSYEIWDQRRILDLEKSAATSEDIDIDFTRWMPSGLPCLLAGKSDSSLPSYLAVLPASVLADIFAEHGSLLLESNVRTFLSARGAVNSGIQQTLKNAPDRFLAYNNGLTTTALSVDVDDLRRGTYIKSIKGLQIVNGGQTTSSIAHYLRGSKDRSVDGVSVQMKLVVVDPSDSSEIVNSVAKYANSQNKVSGADLFSTHDFHIRLEKISRSVKAPAKIGEQFRTGWYYERVRGQWENDRTARGSREEQRKFELEFPKAQRITKTDWAKYLYCWQQLPHIVSKGAQSVFNDFATAVDKYWEQSSEQFDDAYFRRGVAKVVIYKELRANILKQDWYTNSPGYLANIVAYAIAGFSLQLERLYPGKLYDFDAIWKNGRAGKASLHGLLEFAELAQQHLTSADRPNANVTQWAKQEVCWSRFKGKLHRFQADITEDLVVGRESVDPYADYSLESLGSSPTTRVSQVPDDIWSTVVNDGRLTKSELKLIRSLGVPDRRPSIDEAKSLLRVLDRMVDHGAVLRGSY